jgi:spore germination cell wall hydrolase CwlJ-like protein
MPLRPRENRRWRISVEVAGALLCLVAGPHVVSALASTGEAPPATPRRDPAAARRPFASIMANIPSAPSIEALPDAAVDELSPEAARMANAAIPVSDAPNPAARPFRLATGGALDEARAADCMAAAVYYEAGSESLDGQRAVAQVVLNRLRDPVFPKTVCGVVFEGAQAPGCQFTFTCDGALDRPPSQEGWGRARKVAEAALHGYVMKAVGAATHYHADYVVPAWSPALVKVAVVGQHIFYRWPGGVRPAPKAQVASLDDGALDLGKLPLTPVPEEPTAPPQAAFAPVEIAAAAPASPPVESAADRVVDAGAVAPQAGPILKPQDLDWQGRPRRSGPPRLARPDNF